MDTSLRVMGLSFQYVAGSTMKVEALRGSKTLSFEIAPAVVEEPSDRLADSEGLDAPTDPVSRSHGYYPGQANR